jgi:hypothetical protein
MFRARYEEHASYAMTLLAKELAGLQTLTTTLTDSEGCEQRLILKFEDGNRSFVFHALDHDEYRVLSFDTPVDPKAETSVLLDYYAQSYADALDLLAAQSKIDNA